MNLPEVYYFTIGPSVFSFLLSPIETPTVDKFLLQKYNYIEIVLSSVISSDILYKQNKGFPQDDSILNTANVVVYENPSTSTVNIKLEPGHDVNTNLIYYPIYINDLSEGIDRINASLIDDTINGRINFFFEDETIFNKNSLITLDGNERFRTLILVFFEYMKSNPRRLQATHRIKEFRFNGIHYYDAFINILKTLIEEKPFRQYLFSKTESTFSYDYHNLKSDNFKDVLKSTLNFQNLDTKPAVADGNCFYDTIRQLIDSTQNIKYFRIKIAEQFAKNILIDYKYVTNRQDLINERYEIIPNIIQQELFEYTDINIAYDTWIKEAEYIINSGPTDKIKLGFNLKQISSNNFKDGPLNNVFNNKTDNVLKLKTLFHAIIYYILEDGNYADKYYIPLITGWAFDKSIYVYSLVDGTTDNKKEDNIYDRYCYYVIPPSEDTPLSILNTKGKDILNILYLHKQTHFQQITLITKKPKNKVIINYYEEKKNTRDIYDYIFKSTTVAGLINIIKYYNFFGLRETEFYLKIKILKPNPDKLKVDYVVDFIGVRRKDTINKIFRDENGLIEFYITLGYEIELEKSESESEPEHEPESEHEPEPEPEHEPEPEPEHEPEPEPEPKPKIPEPKSTQSTILKAVQKLKIKRDKLYSGNIPDEEERLIYFKNDQLLLSYDGENFSIPFINSSGIYWDSEIRTDSNIDNIIIRTDSPFDKKDNIMNFNMLSSVLTKDEIKLITNLPKNKRNLLRNSRLSHINDDIDFELIEYEKLQLILDNISNSDDYDINRLNSYNYAFFIRSLEYSKKNTEPFQNIQINYLDKKPDNGIVRIVIKKDGIIIVFIYITLNVSDKYMQRALTFILNKSYKYDYFYSIFLVHSIEDRKNTRKIFNQNIQNGILGNNIDPLDIIYPEYPLRNYGNNFHTSYDLFEFYWIITRFYDNSEIPLGLINNFFNRKNLIALMIQQITFQDDKITELRLNMLEHISNIENINIF